MKRLTHWIVAPACVGSIPTSHPIFTALFDLLGRSQVGKARDFDSRMRWFESSRPSQNDSLAQLVEHLTFNQGVPGSNPGWITNFFADVAELADALDLGSSGKPCRFNSCHPHQIYRFTIAYRIHKEWARDKLCDPTAT